MTAARALLAVLGAAVVATTLAIGEPEVLRVRGPVAVAAFVAAAGALAAEAIPLRRLGAACSLATMAAAACVLAQLPPQAPAQTALGALILGLQLTPLVAARRARPG